MLPFNDLKLLQQQLAPEVNAAVRRVLDSGYYILGPELKAFEQAFAAYHGVNHAVGVANGTDAIELALRAGDVGPGDEVITVSHTALPTVCAIERAGATPVLVDIDPITYTLDPRAAEAAITPRTRAIVPVHLYGQAADLTQLVMLTQKHNLLLIEDCAQAHGARWNGQLVGTFGQMATFSFYPTKNVGAYGDAGAVITNDAHFAERLTRLRNYGQVNRYIYGERGVNSRLDEIQAAILQIKLKHLDAHNAERVRYAAQYDAGLQGVQLPTRLTQADHVYHLYVVRHDARDRLMEMLKAREIGTLIHYPVPIHLQESHQDLGYTVGSLPETEKAASEILSLPMYVGLGEGNVQRVIEAVNTCVREMVVA